MVSLPEVIASNERIASTLPEGLVAVFVGGTSGVGEYTLKAFAKYAVKPRVYTVGRSQEAADRIFEECKQLNPGGKFEFIKADVSILKNIDLVCREIKSKETKINILFESQGSMAFKSKTEEGLQIALALGLHSRIRFILNLLPLVQQADSLRRVISVGAATLEGTIHLDQISGEGFGLMKMRNHFAACQTLLLEQLAHRAPNVSFVHTLPGIVKSGISRAAEGVMLNFIIVVSRPLGFFLGTPPDECGERHVFTATSAVYARKTGGTEVLGVPLVGNLEVARGTDGHLGSGVYSVDNRKSEVASPKVEQVLAQYRGDGTAQKVWDYVMTDFERITGVEMV